jgi:hypothetical protein
MFKWLKEWLLPEQPPKKTVQRASPAARHNPDQTLAAQRIPASMPIPSIPDTLATQPINMRRLGSNEEAQVYLNKLHSKIHALADRFAAGSINRKQFEDLYAHYQNDIQVIDTMMAENPESDAWMESMKDGDSILIRRRHTAHLTGFSIYDKQSGMPLKTLGEFRIDPALFVPMMFAYQSATQEIFGGSVRSTQIEGGQWLSFAPGERTTTMALFTNEPSGNQIKMLEELQRVFENANRNRLAQPVINASELVIPHEFFMGKTGQ